MAGDFPLPGPRRALQKLLVFFQDHQKDLRDKNEEYKNGTVGEETFISLCASITSWIYEAGSVIGFLIRATNVRNSFEWHWPLQRLADGIFDDVKKDVIISAEWNFYPHTHLPIVKSAMLEHLAEFAFIGLPAYETRNPLIIPLAGHEIGHSLWAAKNYDLAILNVLKQKLGAIYVSILDLSYPPQGEYRPPSARIWAKVCGLAEPLRSRRLLLMLTAFIDDSDIGGQGPVAILAGWVAPATTWASFSDAWKAEVLDTPKPAIKVFKPRSWNMGPLPKQRLDAAISVIKKHDGLQGVVTIVPRDAHRALFKKEGMPKKLRSPYFLAFFGAVLLVANHYGSLGYSDKVSFVFDHQPGQEEAVRETWKHLLLLATPEMKSILKPSPPAFEADENEQGLQAAHLLAWALRRSTASRWEQGAAQFATWTTGLKILKLVWTPETLDLLLSGILPPTKS